MRASWDYLVTSHGRRLVRCATACTCLFAYACGVDERTLSTAAGSMTGSGASSLDAGAGAGAAPDSGSGGGAAASVALPICVYEGDVSPECETLVKNAGFASGIVSWTAEAATLSDWLNSDAAGSDQSGSLRVVNFLHGETDGVAPGASVQCVAARAGRVYAVAGDVFIADGQGAGIEQGKGDGLTAPPYVGKAGFSLYFFRKSDCSEDSIGNADSGLIDQVGVWVHTEGSGKAPEQTRSMLVRLNTMMPFREFKFEARFDNILVRER